ncbi:PREDICTED: ankyrin repeat and SAM domain-containing protein 6-like isoform X2 [Nicotiana attenuata]|uniref:ankyrin repeat and SAM domain-containing protein 6-like isoform X2 n=1 Tax=Nicotiana attenuata TaxID=49451 RepID=UPI000904FCCA|nr:PREDICTED: ankyrin repeat and SAM domain-containing protein 6-like isoform X2 [Nicotiana attenuata]
MSRPQVTITLGRSGQVVKRSSASQGTGFGQQTLSGGKRSLGETYRTDSEDPSLSLRKRFAAIFFSSVRGYGGAGDSRYGGPNDVRVGQNDLRLKLIRRRRQKEIILEIEKRKKEQHKMMAESVRSAEQSHRKLVTVGQRSSGASELHQMEAMRSSYASQIYGGVRPKSPNRLPKDSREISSPSNITATQHVLSIRPAETSRAVGMLRADLLNPSPLKGLTPMTMRSTLVAGKSMLGLSSANGSMLQSSYPDPPPMTVVSLLNSLGLGKYAIHFQAEEIDMAALKQMGDRDLKELGIPMGPRKKILLAMLPQNKRAMMQVVGR